MNSPDLGKLLMGVGLLLLVVGACLLLAPRVPWLGRLPGDIHYQKGNFTFYFPLATLLLVNLHDLHRDAILPALMRLSDYHYDLPDEHIAREPATPRDAARLFVLSRDGRPDEHRHSPTSATTWPRATCWS